MSTKTLSLITSIVTVILLLLLGALLVFMEMVALNGFSEQEGGPALIVSLACQGVGLILSALLTARLTRHFADRSKWGKFPAAAVSVLAGLLLGSIVGGVAFAAALIAAQALSGS